MTKTHQKCREPKCLGSPFCCRGTCFFFAPQKKTRIIHMPGTSPWPVVSAKFSEMEFPHFGQLQAVEERTQILQLWWGMKGYRVKIVRPQARPKPSRPENGTRFQRFIYFADGCCWVILGDVRVATAFLEWRDVASFYPEETNAYKCVHNSNRYPYKTSFGDHRFLIFGWKEWIWNHFMSETWKCWTNHFTFPYHHDMETAKRCL